MSLTNPQAALDAATRLAQAQTAHRTKKGGFGDGVTSVSTTTSPPTTIDVLSSAEKFLQWLDEKDQRNP